MSLGKEEIEVVGLADRQTERVEADRRALRGVNTTEVDDELLVEKTQTSSSPVNVNVSPP